MLFPYSLARKKRRLKIVILGAGGHAKVIAEVIWAINQIEPQYELIGFLDDDLGLVRNAIAPVPLIGSLDSLKLTRCDAVIVGIGDNLTRERIFNDAVEKGKYVATLVHPRAFVAPSAEIGQGSVLCVGAIVNTGAKVGKNVIVNTGATVDHHNNILDHVHLAPGVHLGGTVNVGEGTFLGIGAAVLPNLSIGSAVTIGAGAVVTKNLPNNVTAVGVPAKIIREVNVGDTIHSFRDVVQGADGKEIDVPGYLRKPEPDAHPDRKITKIHGGTSLPSLSIFGSGDETQWNEMLSRCLSRDFYFLPAYSKEEALRTKSTAELWVYEDGGYLVAFPFLVRAIDLCGIEVREGARWIDMSTVYGYSGPITNATRIPETVSARFQLALAREMKNRGVVSVFARLHPLMNQESLLNLQGVLLRAGRTVSIKLSQSDNSQLSEYRLNHIRDIRKLPRAGCQVELDSSWKHLSAFVEIYHNTMIRVNATRDYLFSPEYFEQLKSLKDAKSYLIICSLGGEIISGGIFIECGNIMEFHLGGTIAQFVKLAPMKAIIDFARRLGNERHLRHLHLGGGVGAAEDSLFRFKAGFSTERHEFYTWRWIVDLPRYNALCRQRFGEASGNVEDESVAFFPAYRNTEILD
jgi:sugar O-acyltransferase (sialic acid O-acetyltransferase NeuD family)